MDTKEIDRVATEVIRDSHHGIIFYMRDKSHYTPVKVRTAIWISDGESFHMVEIENAVDADSYEEAYQEFLRRDVINSAKDIIDGD